MDSSTLTADYLALVRAHGATARDLIREPESDLPAKAYGDKLLSRPLFLGHQEQVRLTADLELFRSALDSLPDRLFGGDLAAFCRAVGLTEVQVEAVMRSRSGSAAKPARVDLYREESGFRLLEINVSSALGGLDNADVGRAQLGHPLLREFADRHGLVCVDTFGEHIRDLYEDCGLVPGDDAVVVVADWPTSFQDLGPYWEAYARRLREHGVNARHCHLGELDVREGRVWLGDLAVDVIERKFLLEDLLESPGARELMFPVLDAAEAGQVRIFTPLDAEPFTSKAALAMLSDEQNRHLFGADELAALDRLLPWTRVVRPGPVTLESGERVDLLEYAIRHQRELAFKPTMAGGGGRGIVLGWEKATTPELWREQLTTGLDSPAVLQRRVRPVTEYFPDEQGELVPYLAAWGVFLGGSGFGGIYARATTLDSDRGVVNVTGGASAGSGLCQLPRA
ncbi:hypothetical protein GCM10009760_29850 [Kitasatospora kazusensis]|uniref:Circularly permuted ATP-grasp superfamily protein n=1 Tax=Kitasatospora kazusensis TaxID=407974 RepID=A0ABP5L905_9ACTN